MASILQAAADTATGLVAAVQPSKPIQLYGHTGGPNPYKVAIILEELDLPYEIIQLDFKEVKEEKFTSLNPNGRVPAIVDPNTGLTIWESNAIVQYLADTYDRSGLLSYKAGRDYYAQLQFLYFQASGQGPYFGQKVFFSVYHPEKLPSAIERYANEVDRVTSVIELHLKQKGTQYLVGDKVTIADLSFIPWNWMLSFILGEDEEKSLAAKYPLFSAWRVKLESRPAVQKVWQLRQKATGKA